MSEDVAATTSSRRRRRHRRARRAAGPWALQAGLWALLLLVVLTAWAGARSARLGIALKLLDADVRLLEQRPELRTEPEQLASLEHAADAVRAQAGVQVEAQELLARVHWLLASAADTPKARIAELRHARDALHLALRQRSSWPYSWALLARIEFNLAPRGAAARIALTQALDLGMRGFGLQRELLELRALAEGRIDDPLMLRLRNSFLDGLREHGPQLAEQSYLLGRLDWPCADADARALVEAWCVRMEGVIRSRSR